MDKGTMSDCTLWLRTMQYIYLRGTAHENDRYMEDVHRFHTHLLYAGKGISFQKALAREPARTKLVDRFDAVGSSPKEIKKEEPEEVLPLTQALPGRGAFVVASPPTSPILSDAGECYRRVSFPPLRSTPRFGSGLHQSSPAHGTASVSVSEHKQRAHTRALPTYLAYQGRGCGRRAYHHPKGFQQGGLCCR